MYNVDASLTMYIKFIQIGLAFILNKSLKKYYTFATYIVCIICINYVHVRTQKLMHVCMYFLSYLGSSETALFGPWNIFRNLLPM